MNQVAVVIGVGLDLSGEDTYEITAQVIKPSASGMGSGGSELPTWSLTASGKTVMDAITHLNRISPRRLYWPHLQIIIFGERLAKKGVAPVITWFERDRDSRTGTYVVTTKGTAKDLLNHKIELGNVPAKAMADLLDTAKIRQISVQQITMREFMSTLTTPGVSAALDVIDSKVIRGKVETYQLSGIALFREDKLVGYVTGTATNGTNIANNDFNNTTIKCVCPGSKGEFLTYQVTDFSNKVRPVVKGDQITLAMNIFIEGNLSDQTCKEDLVDPKMMKAVEDQVRLQIKRDVLAVFTEASSLKVDVLGIGREVRRYYPKMWHNIADHWTDILPKVVLDIQVDANIRRSGLIFRPTNTKLKY